MPLTDPNFWQELGKWIGGIVATAATFFGMVSKWHGDRFRAVEDDVKILKEKNSEHETRIRIQAADAKNAHETMNEIKVKLDKLIDLQIASRN